MSPNVFVVPAWVLQFKTAFFFLFRVTFDNTKSILITNLWIKRVIIPMFRKDFSCTKPKSPSIKTMAQSSSAVDTQKKVAQIHTKKKKKRNGRTEEVWKHFELLSQSKYLTIYAENLFCYLNNFTTFFVLSYFFLVCKAIEEKSKALNFVLSFLLGGRRRKFEFRKQTEQSRHEK